MPGAQYNAVSQGYFATMEIPVMLGREFSPTDRLGAPGVAIVNQELARRTWPGESPLGKRITLPGPPRVGATVVGVVGNVKHLTLSHPDEPQIYLAKAQTGGIFTSLAFVSVPLVLVLVAAVACWVPARRAARVDPVVALGAE